MVCVVFDCDGVLVESESISIAAELAFLARHGVHVDRDDYVRRFMGTSKPDWIEGVTRLIRDETGRAPGPGQFERLVDDVKRAVTEDLQLVDGAYAAVAGMAHSKCVASSSGLPALEAKLRATGLKPFFGDGVFSADQVAKGKPAPDLFLHAAARMGAQPGDCVVIEDSVNGIVAARRAGMTAIGLVAGSHCPAGHGDALAAGGAEYVAASFDAVTQWLATRR